MYEDKTGKILGVNPETENLIGIKGIIDFGKSIDGVFPESWGSARIATVSENGDLAKIKRLVTKDDV